MQLIRTPGEIRPADLKPRFADIYQAALKEQKQEKQLTRVPGVTISADGLPLGEFARYVADQAEVSIIVDQGIEDKLVFAEVRNQPVNEVLSGVARRSGVTMRKQGGIYIIGEAKPEDRAVLVRRVRRLSQAELGQALAVFSAESGRSVAFQDGLIIVGDRVQVLANVAGMLDQVEAIETPVWVVQLHLIGWSRRAAEDFGFDLTPAADLAFGFAVGSSGVNLDLDLGADLDGILRAVADRSDVSVEASPMFVLVDGGTGKVVQGDRVPVPRRTTTEQGTTITEGFEFIQTGTDVTVQLRETREARAKLDVKVNMSDIRSFVEAAPITGEETFQTTAIVQGGGVYLLGSIVKDRHTAEDSIGWRTNEAKSREVQMVQVWCRVYRISGDVGASDNDATAEPVAKLNHLSPRVVRRAVSPARNASWVAGR